jgi:hypothetical protein
MKYTKIILLLKEIQAELKAINELNENTKRHLQGLKTYFFKKLF